jgi:serine/threonine-protein kinase HipA
MSRTILVYADWGHAGVRRFGTLHARPAGGKEVFEFEFSPEALGREGIAGVALDPRIGPFPGPQHAPRGRANFGVFCDASPDRWGRLLMQRRLERLQRAGTIDKRYRLRESDFLLGVHDAYRAGGLRFKLADDGPFLDNQDDTAAPPFVRLRELEAASRALSLALACGLDVPEAQVRRFANGRHTFIVRRFDRDAHGARLHFASAMTLTDRVDGDGAETGASYLELARVLIDHGARTAKDLVELWSRIVFNILVSNTDDHLRNHGFILEPGRGWRLSPAYDMNPVPDAGGLRLNISETDNERNLDLARSVAPYFRVKRPQAEEIIERARRTVRQWDLVAEGVGLSKREREAMADAFAAAR